MYSELVDEQLGLLEDRSVLEWALLERNIVAIFDEAGKLLSLLVRLGFAAEEATVEKDIDRDLSALHADWFILCHVHLLKEVNLIEHVDQQIKLRPSLTNLPDFSNSYNLSQQMSMNSWSSSDTRK